MSGASRCLVIHVDVAGTHSERTRLANLEEAVGLAEAIALEVGHAEVVRVQRVVPATYIGKGKAEELAALIEAQELSLAIINTALSPVQQRNLETRLKCKVIDRTALILEIFGARARTAEGKLQVELAALTYQKSRLVRSWTHLERQRGGFGFLGGPGESQIEIDRRLIGERIDKIKAQLAQVVRTRDLHRAKRRDVPYPTVALVGYTNAGKSTLFNRLTKSDVVAKDMLFATLDPTVRGLTLPSGVKILLSDTVGFISALPTELIAAFRATLEEVLEADLLLHVRDGSHTDSDAQKQDVLRVLRSLFDVKDDLPTPLIEIINKCDIEETAIAPTQALRLSALTGEGLDALLHAIEDNLGDHLLETHSFSMSSTNGKAHAWLHANAQVLEQKIKGEKITLKVRISPMNAARYMRQFSEPSRARSTR